MLVLGCFTVCWIPYFVVATVQMFKIVENSSARTYKACFALAMSNSGMNPLIYAWKNTAFRKAFGRLLRCKMPDTIEPVESVRSNMHRKSSSMMPNHDMFNCSRAEMTPPPSAAATRARLGSCDTETGIDVSINDFNTAPRGSISDSGVVIMIKHPRLSSISSEHRYSQTTINEELMSNHTTMVTFSSSQDNDSSECNDTPKRRVSIELPSNTHSNNSDSNRPPIMKLVRNKCAILESFDSMSDESSSKSPVKIPQQNHLMNGTILPQNPSKTTTETPLPDITMNEKFFPNDNTAHNNVNGGVRKTKTSKFNFNLKNYFRSKQTPAVIMKNKTLNCVDVENRQKKHSASETVCDNGKNSHPIPCQCIVNENLETYVCRL